jgi:DNA-binding CsgD family transcriptional regulator
MQSVPANAECEQLRGRAALLGPRQEPRMERALAPAPRPARLRVYQHPRNPTAYQRRILTLIAEGLTQRQAASHLGVNPRCVASALASMRERYTATTNEALIALAIRLQWIEIAIDIHQDATSPPPQTW